MEALEGTVVVEAVAVVGEELMVLEVSRGMAVVGVKGPVADTVLVVCTEEAMLVVQAGAAEVEVVEGTVLEVPVMEVAMGEEPVVVKLAEPEVIEGVAEGAVEEAEVGTVPEEHMEVDTAVEKELAVGTLAVQVGMPEVVVEAPVAVLAGPTVLVGPGMAVVLVVGTVVATVATPLE